MSHAADSLQTDSWLIAAGRTDSAGAPLNVPLIAASNFLIGAGRQYARNEGTPTWEALEAIIGGLEGGQAISFASGMAAVAAVFDQLPVGARVVLPDDVYQGVATLAKDGANRGRWQVTRLAAIDTARWVEAAGQADLIWLESPSNPLLTVADLEVICQAPRKAGAILAVDNTFATPLNQQPLALGADVSMQSATKFIGGHSDLLCGSLSTTNTALYQGLRHSRELNGATPGALEAFLAVRGVRTLALRLAKAQNNAMALAERLQGHPKVSVVRYPGLSTHPTHAVACRVLRGFGSMLSFDLHGDAAMAEAVCRNTRLIRHATSLGSVESTMERRGALAGQTHLPPTLLRLSVGIEAMEDLWADLCGAIDRSAP